jgi:hypothetical protein
MVMADTTTTRTVSPQEIIEVFRLDEGAAADLNERQFASLDQRVERDLTVGALATRHERHHMNRPPIHLFSGDEVIDELVRREGPEWVVRKVNEGARYPVSSIEELRRRC